MLTNLLTAHDPCHPLVKDRDLPINPYQIIVPHILRFYRSYSPPTTANHPDSAKFERNAT